MERELWPGLDRWVSAPETTNRAVYQATSTTGAPHAITLLLHNGVPTLLPYCLTTEEDSLAMEIGARYYNVQFQLFTPMPWISLP